MAVTLGLSYPVAMLPASNILEEWLDIAEDTCVTSDVTADDVTSESDPGSPGRSDSVDGAVRFRKQARPPPPTPLSL
eukprot:1182004-Prorocentrum_minimum.AAC.2